MAGTITLLVLSSGCGLAADSSPRNIDLSEQPIGLPPPPAAAAGDNDPRVWYLLDDDGLKLRDVSRDVEPTYEALLQALLGGPNSEEQRQGILNQIPAGTTLLNVSAPDEVGTLAVDLSEEFLTQEGAAVGNALGQVVFTATEDPKVRRVVVTVAGDALPWVIDDRRVAEGEGMTRFAFPALDPTEYPDPGVSPTSPTTRPPATTTTRPPPKGVD